MWAMMPMFRHVERSSVIVQPDYNSEFVQTDPRSRRLQPAQTCAAAQRHPIIVLSSWRVRPDHSQNRHRFCSSSPVGRGVPVSAPPAPYASAHYRRVWGSVSRSLPLLPEAFLQASFLSHPGKLQRVAGQRATDFSLRDSPDPQVSLEADSIALYRLLDQSHLKSLAPNRHFSPVAPPLRC